MRQPLRVTKSNFKKTTLMKRIGILTYFTDIPYFNDINPGMNLQAYAVYSALKAQYPKAHIEFIRYHSWWAEWRPYISGMTIGSLLQDFKQLIKYHQFTKSFPKSHKALVSRDREKSLRFIDRLNYNAIYVGSDTLLELFRCEHDDISAYWLNNEVRAKKFMIAASARDTSFEMLSSKQKELMDCSISSFDMLGVRDVATFDLVKGFISSGDPRLRIVSDPTFSLEIDYTAAERYVQRKGLIKRKRPIVCFHLLKTSPYALELANIYRNKGYLVASLRPASYADFILKDLSPMEFAGIFKFFDLVLTHRFHDSVFCIKNLCPVLLYPPSKIYENAHGDSKQSSLMEMFDIKHTSFVRDISSLSAKDIYLLLESAKENFVKNKNSIAAINRELKSNFEDYVRLTSESII